MTTTEDADIFPELSDDKVNKAIVDYTSPALCTPSPLPAVRRCSLL